MLTVQQFVEACKSLNSEMIYDLFYDASDELRDAIFAEVEGTLGVVLEHENEPTRASMYALGVKYNVQSLRDY